MTERVTYSAADDMDAPELPSWVKEDAMQMTYAQAGVDIEEGARAVDAIKDGDVVSVDADSGTITNETTGAVFRAQPFPPFIQEIIDAGGLVERTRRVLRNTEE